MEYVLALDQGTTSSRAILYDRSGAIRASAQREFEQIYPSAGWVEHDPEEIWASQMSVAVEALSRANIRPRDIAALGITNQRETTIVWERKTGRPVYNAIVWQDRRTAPICERLREQGLEETIRPQLRGRDGFCVVGIITRGRDGERGFVERVGQRGTDDEHARVVQSGAEREDERQRAQGKHDGDIGFAIAQEKRNTPGKASWKRHGLDPQWTG